MIRWAFHRFWQTIRIPLRLAGGTLLVLVGVAGVILPILPGWIFIIAGLTILFPRSFGRWFKSKWEALKRWYGARKDRPPRPPDRPDPTAPK